MQVFELRPGCGLPLCEWLIKSSNHWPECGICESSPQSRWISIQTGQPIHARVVAPSRKVSLACPFFKGLSPATGATGLSEFEQIGHRANGVRAPTTAEAGQSVTAGNRAKKGLIASSDEPLSYQLDGGVMDPHGCYGWRGILGSIPERKPETRLPSLRTAAGAQIAQLWFMSEAATSNGNRVGPMGKPCSQWMLSKPSNDYPLEDQSGASTRGNSSSRSVYEYCCCWNARSWMRSEMRPKKLPPRRCLRFGGRFWGWYLLPPFTRRDAVPARDALRWSVEAMLTQPRHCVRACLKRNRLCSVIMNKAVCSTAGNMLPWWSSMEFQRSNRLCSVCLSQYALWKKCHRCPFRCDPSPNRTEPFGVRSVPGGGEGAFLGLAGWRRGSMTHLRGRMQSIVRGEILRPMFGALKRKLVNKPLRVNQERECGARRWSDTVVVCTVNDAGRILG